MSLNFAFAAKDEGNGRAFCEKVYEFFEGWCDRLHSRSGPVSRGAVVVQVTQHTLLGARGEVRDEHDQRRMLKITDRILKEGDLVWLSYKPIASDNAKDLKPLPNDSAWLIPQLSALVQ